MPFPNRHAYGKLHDQNEEDDGEGLLDEYTKTFCRIRRNEMGKKNGDAEDQQAGQYALFEKTSNRKGVFIA